MHAYNVTRLNFWINGPANNNRQFFRSGVLHQVRSDCAAQRYNRPSASNQRQMIHAAIFKQQHTPDYRIIRS